ncbi:MAG: hypothetical protein ACTTH5_03760 [Wolinella sp.]
MNIQNNIAQVGTLFTPYAKKAEESEGFKEQLTQINDKSAKTEESASVDSLKSPKNPKSKRSPLLFQNFGYSSARTSKLGDTVRRRNVL